jgi:hypothetical protein
MKVILITFFGLLTQYLSAKPVEIDANLKDTGNGYFLNVTLQNKSKVGVYLPTFGGELIDLRLDLWCLGKGIELYSRNDAEWRRRQAFFAYDWRLLQSGEKMTISVDLRQMNPSNEDDDEVAKKIYSDFVLLKKGRASVSVFVQSSDPKVDEKSLSSQIYQSVTIDAKSP